MNKHNQLGIKLHQVHGYCVRTMLDIHRKPVGTIALYAGKVRVSEPHIANDNNARKLLLDALVLNARHKHNVPGVKNGFVYAIKAHTGKKETFRVYNADGKLVHCGYDLLAAKQVARFQSTLASGIC